MCRSHDPEIESEHWFNRGAARLADAFQKQRADQWPETTEFVEFGEPVPIEVDGYHTNAPIFWLEQHPQCDVALRSEYGDTRELSREPHASQSPPASGDTREIASSGPCVHRCEHLYENECQGQPRPCREGSADAPEE